MLAQPAGAEQGEDVAPAGRGEQAAVVAGLGALLGTVSGFVPTVAFLYADALASRPPDVDTANRLQKALIEGTD